MKSADAEQKDFENQILNRRILVVDGSGVDKLRVRGELVERVMQNEADRHKKNHKGGRKIDPVRGPSDRTRRKWRTGK